MQLSEGAIETIMGGGSADNPVLQVLGVKKMSGNNQQDRFRLLLSDGRHSHSSAMLATQLNHMVSDNQLDNNCVIRLEKYVCNTVQERRVMILLNLNVLATGSEVSTRLGEPQPYKPGQPTKQPASAGEPPKSVVSEPPKPQPQVNKPNSTFRPQQPVNSGPTTPLQNRNNQPAGGSFYGGANAKGSKPFNVQNVPKTPGGTPTRIHPISSLNPYQNRWTIRARVTHKSQIRHYSNSKGDGHLFNMNLVDESGEIRATAFKETCDKYYENIDVNKVYFVSKATLKTANKNFSSVDNDYEMTFNSETQMWPCEEAVDLPTINFNFIAINQLEGHAPNSTVDVIGIVKQCDDISTVTGRQSNREIKKRELHLVDQSQSQIRLTLWGKDAETFDSSNSPVVAVKGCRLSDWGGRSLSALSSSQIVLNPEIDQCYQLRGWYDSEGQAATFSEYRSEGQAGSAGRSTNWKTFQQVKSEPLQGDQAIYYTTKATIVFLKKDNCMYMACPSADCNKKVVDQANGCYRCEKCNKEYPNYKWRMILSCNLCDFTDNQWATFFQETAEMILGRPADEIGQLKTQGKDAEFDQMFNEASYKTFILKLRAKVEVYNEESRLKTVCVQANPVNYRDYNKKLIADIDKLLSE